ncbi:MAG: cell division protein FtsL [Eubacterium sp.]|jgi:cell division protein FtsL|nr:cell division protein FtsL [Eubacterium sp.]MCH4047523.1 cell division protein FtsL [Eubacterium sp.]MCH4078293.1 cell division protein FtsL [Eubacterium sp.]MCH4109440.1 cell division protein FtsL [Eubacterium sp.]MCI1307594.1 cell division protein FtsL [Eubacterium sp.]
MKSREKKRAIIAMIVIGLMLIVLVVLTAFASEIRSENNTLITKNEALQGEVDTLSVKIKTSNSVDHIESVAKSKFGMVYPTSDQRIYITSKDKPGQNFAAVIREQAYQ